MDVQHLSIELSLILNMFSVLSIFPLFYDNIILITLLGIPLIMKIGVLSKEYYKEQTSSIYFYDCLAK